VVDEVFGFRRFVDRELADDAPATMIRADRFLAGCFRRGGEVWPVFSLTRLLDAVASAAAGSEERVQRGGHNDRTIWRNPTATAGLPGPVASAARVAPLKPGDGGE
jgi:hypothetical protein